MLSQEYLREERVHEQWDCETILTTYSTLDNHPHLIQVLFLLLFVLTYFRRKERRRGQVKQAVEVKIVLMVNFIPVGH